MYFSDYSESVEHGVALLALHDEYIVLRPFKVEESRVMPWFGQEGMGMQYETGLGMKMTINDLVEAGYLKRFQKFSYGSKVFCVAGFRGKSTNKLAAIS